MDNKEKMSGVGGGWRGNCRDESYILQLHLPGGILSLLAQAFNGCQNIVLHDCSIAEHSERRVLCYPVVMIICGIL